MSELGELHLHRLLVAVDGSHTAELALSAAVTAARRDNAAITLLVVTPDFLAESRLWTTGSPDPNALQREATRRPSTCSPTRSTDCPPTSR
jgi:nucleotide-binding universal stress UspA family protein